MIRFYWLPQRFGKMEYIHLNLVKEGYVGAGCAAAEGDVNSESHLGKQKN